MQRASGVPLDALAKQYKLGRSAIHRHWQNHVDDKARATYLAGPSELADLHAKAAAEGASVLDYLSIVRNSLMAAMATASELGDPRAVATVGTALVGCLEKLGKLTGEIANLGGGNTFNIAFMQSPEWASLQADMLTALAPHPAALADVVAMLRRRDADAAAIAAPARRASITIDHAPAAPIPAIVDLPPPPARPEPLTVDATPFPTSPPERPALDPRLAPYREGMRRAGVLPPPPPAPLPPPPPRPT